MPLSAKGRKILANLEEEYGSKKKAESVLYAMKNSGKVTGIDNDRVREARAILGQFDAWSEEAREAARLNRMFNPPNTKLGRQVKKFLKEHPGGRFKKSKSNLDRPYRIDIDSAPVVSIRDAEPVVPAPMMMYDKIELDAKGDYAPKPTADGYLKAMPRIARTGIQVYLDSECGREGDGEVRVYRPADAVFKRDAMKSYTHLPITIEHPPMPISADNWKDHAVGETGDDTVRDGETVRVPMMLRDAAAIQAVKDGKRQLSVGYACDLDWTPGVTRDGQKYDAVQKNIRANHLAVVSNARGGPILAIGDDKGGQAMTTNLKTMTIDGFDIQVDAHAANVIDRVIQGLVDQAENFKKKKDEDDKKNGEKCDALSADVLKRDEAIKVKDAEIATLKQQLADERDPAKMAARDSERTEVMDKARAILGDKLKPSYAVGDMRRQVVEARMGDTAKGWNDQQIEASFASFTHDIKPGSTPKPTGHGLQDAIRAFAAPAPASDGEAVKAKAYQDMLNDQANAWKGPAQKSA